MGRAGKWYWLSASATRVYGMWGTTTYHDWYPAYVTHAVENAGQLGPAYVRDLGEFDSGQVTVDVNSDVFYKQGDTGVTAHFVEPDGSLRQMGASDLCVDSTLGYGAPPLVAVGGFLFATSRLGTAYPYHCFVCSWEGPRLAPRAKLALDSERTDYAVALSSVDALGASSSPAASSPPSLVAMRTYYTVMHGEISDTQYEVRLLAMSDGDLQALDTVEVEPRYPRHLLFHPSGRFLYVSHGLFVGGATAASPDSLTVYSIDPDGHLAPVQMLEGAGGAMAVTTPPQVRASAGAATD